MINGKKEKNKLAKNEPGLVRIEDLPALSPEEESRLMEVDKRTLARIDGIVPGTLQLIANRSLKPSGPVFQTINLGNAKLMSSREIPGAFRGTIIGERGKISGQANFKDISGKMNVANGVNAAMGIAAMVVGQYYMTQINDQLKTISDDIAKISGFLDTQYRSGIKSLVASLRKASIFETEIMENEEKRKSTLISLESDEKKCTDLLGQANEQLADLAKKNGSDFKKYKEYEKKVDEVYKWFAFQQSLLEILDKICGLEYSLNLGKVSEEQCWSRFNDYVEDAQRVNGRLREWLVFYKRKFGIDTDLAKRNPQGLEELYMSFLALVNDNFKRKTIPEDMAKKIKKMIYTEPRAERNDLFNEDVRLIVKDEKVFYLPPSKLRTKVVM